MFTRRKKFRSDLDAVKQENRLLRLLKLDIGFTASAVSLGKTDREDVYEEGGCEIRDAILEAEYNKAKAIMMMQRQQNL